MSILRYRLWVPVTILVCLLITSPVLAVVHYELTPFGSLFAFTPQAMNNHGEVIGYARQTSTLTTNQGVYWSAQTGAQRLPSWNDSIYYDTYARDINDRGIVAQHTRYYSSNEHSARLYDVRSDSWLTVNDSYASQFHGISNGRSPHATGNYRSQYNAVQDFWWHKSTRYQYISETQGVTQRNGYGTMGLAVNDRGEFVGHTKINGYQQGFVFDSSGTNHTLAELTSGRASEARDINNHGAIVGYSDRLTSDSRTTGRAVMWTSTNNVVDLGRLPTTSQYDESEANAINEWGQVVGWSHTRSGTGSRLQHAFVYQNGTMYDLSDLTINYTGHIEEALDINERGQILTDIGVLNPVHVANGRFDSGHLGNWSDTSAGGTATVITDPTNAANSLVQLTTGSPAAITQTIDTPNQPFDIVFDYEFLTTAGQITVTLDGDDLFTIDASATVIGQREQFVGEVTDQAYFGLLDMDLTITLDGAVAGAQAYIDNVSLALQIPEPTTCVLLMGGLVLLTKRR